jgi:hypothetical protein
MQTFKCQESNAVVWNKGIHNDSVSIHKTFQNRKRKMQHTVERAGFLSFLTSGLQSMSFSG